MSITSARTIRAVTAAAATLALGLATAATAAPIRQFSTINAAATGRSAQPAFETASPDRMVCIRTQRVASRITENFCRTQSQWDARGGLISDQR